MRSGKRFKPWSVACLWLLAIGLWTPAGATHQKAAEITFTHVSGYTYRFRLVTYTFTESAADRPELEVRWGDGSGSVLSRESETVVDGQQTKINVYTGTHTYAGPGSYYISMEDANRNGGVVNMPNSINTPMYVETLLVISPYLSSGNNSPVLTARPVDDRGCVGRRFIHNPGAYDPDGDSLSYRLVRCKTTGGEDIAGYTFPAASDSIYIDERTGDLIWENPVAQGEYNVAVLVREWRNGRLIGEITRDMQIVVQMCDNYPPDLICDDTYCVEAGQMLRFEPYALDMDGDGIRMNATGEILSTRREADLRFSGGTSDSVRYEFVWQTSLADSRAQPYGLYLKATDGGTPPLSDLKTVSVQVLAPAVRGLRANYDLRREEVRLQWQKSLSPHAVGYKLYRRAGAGEETAFDACRGGAGAGYALIATLDSPADTVYIDREGLASGMRYGYQVCAYFADGAESYASAPACVEIASYTPVFTRISVAATDAHDGRMDLAWRHPRAWDSVLDGYGYGLFGGATPETMHFMGRFAMDSVVTLVDTALNTVGHPYYYRLGLLPPDGGGGHGGTATDSLAADDSTLAYATPVYASVYLMAVPHSRRVELTWGYEHPWQNDYFTVYRQHPDSAAFAPVARVAARHYEDVGLENGRTYRYYVEGFGTYYNDSLPSPLLNLSNVVAVAPETGTPCRPTLVLRDSSCNPLRNTLAWHFEVGEGGGAADSSALEDCLADAAHYKLYYKRVSEKVYDEVAATEETWYEHEPDGYWACYYVTAVNERGEEGEASNIVYVDNRGCFTYRLPNVFTPNGDGCNDTFRALPNQYVEGFRIYIYNRWGNPVFSSDDPRFEWNGRMGGNGQECPDGVYFYVVEFTVEAEGLGDKIYQSGSVTILR